MSCILGMQVHHVFPFLTQRVKLVQNPVSPFLNQIHTQWGVDLNL